MTPSTIDRSELEDRVRAALASRARSTRVDVPDGFATPVGVRPPSSRRARPMLLVAAAAVVLAVVGLAVFVARDDDETTTGPPATSPEERAPGVPVSGPTGSRWFLLDVPGVTPGSSDRSSTPASPSGAPELQAFRSEAGFDGPAVWVEPGGQGEGGDGATEVTVQGRPAFVRTDGDVVRLVPSWEDAFYLTAANISVDDLVAFADGLQPRDAGGWEATVLPGGLVEVSEVEPAQPASEHAEWDYAGADGANYELFVNPGGQATFESWARELVSSGTTVTAISVDGRPGVVIESQSEVAAVWRPTDDVVVDFRTNLDRDGLLDAMAALRPVDEATWIGVFDQPPERD